MAKETRIIVSGILRSGTSMIMKMLEDGGIPVYFDKPQRKNKHNLNGVYENKASIAVKQNLDIFQSTKNKALKIFAGQIINLPTEYNYKLIYIYRDLLSLLSRQ